MLYIDNSLDKVICQSDFTPCTLNNDAYKYKIEFISNEGKSYTIHAPSQLLDELTRINHSVNSDINWDNFSNNDIYYSQEDNGLYMVMKNGEHDISLTEIKVL